MTISLQRWFIVAEKVGSSSLSTSISLWSEKVVSTHLCKPKKGDLVFFVCVFKREGGSVRCEVTPPPTAAQGQGYLCEVAARGRPAAE